jgi:hypothetical protein
LARGRGIGCTVARRTIDNLKERGELVLVRASSTTAAVCSLPAPVVPHRKYLATALSP